MSGTSAETQKVVLISGCSTGGIGSALCVFTLTLYYDGLSNIFQMADVRNSLHEDVLYMQRPEGSRAWKDFNTQTFESVFWT